MEFQDIIKVVEKNNKKLDNKAFFDTEKGIWGPSSINDCKELFEKIQLQNYKHFCDLGSGDGRIVAVAALFTQATGIEYEEKLHNIAIQMKEELHNPENMHFLKEDFTKTDLSQYDCLLLFMIKDLSIHLKKIKEEFKGDIYLYEGIHKPASLQFVKIIWIGQTPIYMYTTI